MTNPSFPRGPARRPAPVSQETQGSSYTRPASAEEAQARFWHRYGWALVQEALGHEQAGAESPQTIDGWIRIAELVRDHMRLSSRERLARMFEAAAQQIRQQ